MEEKTIVLTHTEITFLIYAINARLVTIRGLGLYEEEYLMGTLEKLEKEREK